MLTILSLPLAYVAPLAPARGVVTRADAPAMVKSEALPFLDAPSKLDGSMVGDVVSCAPGLRSACAPSAAAPPAPRLTSAARGV